jgi:hypothetical protein
MSISLLLRSVNDAQASALREGIISPADLLTSNSASYDGSGDVTHFGYGCVLTLAVIMFIFLPVLSIFGWKFAVIVASLFEVYPIYFTWYIRSRSRRKVDLKVIDPLKIIPNDSEFCLYEWHGLHYLLTGSDGEGTSPENFLVHGGDLLPESSISGEYGPARIIATCELPAIQEVLKRLNLSDAIGRLEQATKTLTIHPSQFNKENLESEYQRLCQYIEKANESCASIVMEMC